MWGEANIEHNADGVRFHEADGVIKGRLYTAFPLRLRTAGAKYLIVNLLVFIAAVFFADSKYADIKILNNIAGIAWLCVVFLYYPFLLITDCKRIKITDTHFHVGWMKYRLKHMSSFRAKKVVGKNDQFVIQFYYDKDKVEIGVRNNFDSQLNVIKALNHQVEQGIDAPSDVNSTMLARSAGF